MWIAVATVVAAVAVCCGGALLLGAFSSLVTPAGQVDVSSQETDGLSDRQRAYLVELAAIDAGLVVHEQRALTRAENTCLDVRSGGFTEEQLVDRVVYRLSGGNATIDREQGRHALQLMRTYIC